MNADDIIAFRLYLMQKIVVVVVVVVVVEGNNRGVVIVVVAEGNKNLSRTHITGLWNRGKSSGVTFMI